MVSFAETTCVMGYPADEAEHCHEAQKEIPDGSNEKLSCDNLAGKDTVHNSYYNSGHLRFKTKIIHTVQ